MAQVPTHYNPPWSPPTQTVTQSMKKDLLLHIRSADLITGLEYGSLYKQIMSDDEEALNLALTIIEKLIKKV